MPKKVIAGNFSVNVAREGELITVKKDEPFDFTDAEVKDIVRAQGEDALRDPINEVGDEPTKVKRGKAGAAEKPGADAAKTGDDAAKTGDDAGKTNGSSGGAGEL